MSIVRAPGPNRFRDACSRMGWWWPSESSPFRLPIDLAGIAYVALTEGKGEVTVGDERAYRYGLEEGFWEFDDCPLSKWDAIDHVVKIFGFHSRGACHKQLQRRWLKIREMKANGTPQADALPDLSGLPYADSMP